MLRVLKRFVRDDRGAAMVELALVAGVIFIPLLFGVIEIGRAIWTKSMVTAAAREGVRFAIVRGSESGITTDSAGVANYVIGRTQLTGIKVSPTWPSGNKEPGSIVQVAVSFAYVPVVPVFPSKTITSTSRQIIAF